jgi:3-oxoacyl-(acyl-carrier-protein) synthase
MKSPAQELVKIVVTSKSTAAPHELTSARLGTRFARLDLCSQLAVLAVEKLALQFDSLPRDRIAICLAVPAGSLATDLEYWQGRDAAGGPSPTLFAYTLPSSALGEIAIRHRLTGPNLCFFGEADLLEEATQLIQSGEADGCLCVSCRVITEAVAKVLDIPAMTEANATFVLGESRPVAARKPAV